MLNRELKSINDSSLLLDLECLTGNVETYPNQFQLERYHFIGYFTAIDPIKEGVFGFDVNIPCTEINIKGKWAPKLIKEPYLFKFADSILYSKNNIYIDRSLITYYHQRNIKLYIYFINEKEPFTGELKLTDKDDYQVIKNSSNIDFSDRDILYSYLCREAEKKLMLKISTKPITI